MHPARYSFIRNGPDCRYCGHRRVEHIAMMESIGALGHDGPCQECADCPGYMPVGDVDYVVMRKAEFPIERAEYDAHVRNQERRTTALRVLAVLALITAIGSVFWSEWALPLVGVVLLAVAANSANAAFSAYRDRNRREFVYWCWAVVMAGSSPFLYWLEPRLFFGAVFLWCIYSLWSIRHDLRSVQERLARINPRP